MVDRLVCRPHGAQMRGLFPAPKMDGWWIYHFCSISNPPERRKPWSYPEHCRTWSNTHAPWASMMLKHKVCSPTLSDYTIVWLDNCLINMCWTNWITHQKIEVPNGLKKKLALQDFKKIYTVLQGFAHQAFTLLQCFLFQWWTVVASNKCIRKYQIRFFFSDYLDRFLWLY